MMFSTRVPSDLAENRFARTLARARGAGSPILDLTVSNPTRVGLDYPADLLQPLADPGALRYDPHPFGLPDARAAVAAEFARRGVEVAPDRVALTASTSEAYSLLFKLLCAPGDRVLIPQPSYPLFEHLTRLDGVEADPYHLEYHGVWTIDVDGLARAIQPRTRAVLIVSPNNPTGSFLKPDELERIAALSADRSLALISDEVFADYPMDPDARPAMTALAVASSGQGRRQPLTFSLGGLSKSAGLPQVKLGWLAVGGPDALVREALARLELVCDTYLSVATPVERAAAALIAGGRAIRAQIAARVGANYARLADMVGQFPACALLPCEGGWSAVVRVPATRSEEQLVVTLLEQDHVLVYPGYFFDFPHEAFVVVSLLAEPSAFAAAARRVLERATRD